jgi:NADH-quinone oxidoreductase subunit J
VTFLFVIMLAQQSGSGNADLRSREPFLASVAGFVLLASLLGVLHRTFDQRELNEISGDLSWLAEDAKTIGDVDKKYGKVDITNPATIKLALAEKLKKYLPDTGDPDRDYAGRLEIARIEANVEALRAEAKKARAALDDYRVGYGTVVRSPTAGKLPAENVAALGYTLFTEYLVPVELAGVLLLVATIGAIAIVGRRQGELR